MDARELGDRYLGGLLLNPADVDEYPLPLEALPAPRQQHLLAAIRSLAARGDEVGVVGVRVELSRQGHSVDTEWLLSITGTLDVDARATSARLMELHAARKLVDACSEASVLARSGNLTEARQKLAQAVDDRSEGSDEVISMKEVMIRTVNAWEAIKAGESLGFSLGIHSTADDAITVLPDKGDCVIVAARPGVGKSTVVDQCMVSLARRGIVCGKVSVEDGDEDFGAKTMGVLGGVSTAPFWKGRASQADWDAVTVGAGRGASLPIHFSQVKSNSLDRVIASMTTMHRKHGARVIAVDYIQRIGGVDGNDARDRMDKVLGALIRTARTLPCALLLVSQLKRAGENPYREPVVEDLKESGSLEEAAQGIVLLWKTTDDREDEAFGLVRGKVAKVKRGDFGQRFAFRRNQRSGALDEVDWRYDE